MPPPRDWCPVRDDRGNLFTLRSLSLFDSVVHSTHDTSSSGPSNPSERIDEDHDAETEGSRQGQGGRGGRGWSLNPKVRTEVDVTRNQ